MLGNNSRPHCSSLVLHCMTSSQSVKRKQKRDNNQQHNAKSGQSWCYEKNTRSFSTKKLQNSSSWQTSAKTHTIGVLCLLLATYPLCRDPTVSLDKQTISFHLYCQLQVRSVQIPKLEQATLSERVQTRIHGKLITRRARAL